MNIKKNMKIVLLNRPFFKKDYFAYLVVMVKLLRSKEGRRKNEKKREKESKKMGKKNEFKRKKKKKLMFSYI